MQFAPLPPVRRFARAVAAVALALFALTLPGAAQATGRIPKFNVTSPVFVRDGVFQLEQVYDRSGCHGQNISPELHWTDPPKAAASFAVAMFDEDAAAGRGWWHWAIFNLPPETRALAAGAGKPGHAAGLGANVRQARNDYGDVGYSGPCPPRSTGSHHYVITVYALDEPQVAAGEGTPGAAKVVAELERHAVAKGSLTGKFPD